MRNNLKSLERYFPFLLLLLLVDGACILILWIADLNAFRVLAAVFVLGTLLFFGILCIYIAGYEKKRQQAFLDFLDNPDEYHEESLRRLSSHIEADMIHLLGERLRKQEASYYQLMAHISDYEEYVEAWAHETKMPVSLLTLLLDNRREELPKNVGYKLDYIRNRMQEYVNQMLFYARLKAVRKDYFLEFVHLPSCIEDSLEDYRPLLEEKGFQINIKISGDYVYSDRRGLGFIISQAVSNAVKYSSSERTPELSIQFIQGEESGQLLIKDNGIGVKESDLPYIFEKGFTGLSGEDRKKATGMGLYLAEGIAHDLKLSLEASSQWKEGFELKIVFPVINMIHDT